MAIVLLRHHPAEVTSAVWTHGILVAASALVAFGLAVRAARGSRGAYRRLRIASAVIVVAIAAVIAVPGSFPLWMKAEQGLAGLFMIGVAVLVNRRRTRRSPVQAQAPVARRGRETGPMRERNRGDRPTRYAPALRPGTVRPGSPARRGGSGMLIRHGRRRVRGAGDLTRCD